MIPKEAIERAIEGGWDSDDFFFVAPTVAQEAEMYGDWQFNPHRIALDPTFWQALGKALGWTKSSYNNTYEEDWMEVAHTFYDILLTGGDTEALWKELL